MEKIDEDLIYKSIYGNTDHLREDIQPWNKIATVLDVTRPVRHEHLIKLFYYKNQSLNNDDLERWISLARKGFEGIPKEMNTNKYPIFDKLYNQVWLSITDSFPDFHIRVIKELNGNSTAFKKIEDTDLNGVMNFISEYNKWACKKISQAGGIEALETMEEIKLLLKMEV